MRGQKWRRLKGFILDFHEHRRGAFLTEEKDHQFNNNLKTTCYSSQAKANASATLFENYKWMTTSEAATYLRKSSNALRTAVCRGHISARKFKRRLYFKRSELDRLIETSTTVGG